jgi:hypothetical protein
LLQIGRHRKLFLQDALANHLSLRVADSFGRSDQYSALRRLHVVEGVARHRLHNFVVDKRPSGRGTLMLMRSNSSNFLRASARQSATGTRR